MDLQIPSCTCPDWIRTQYPCKHFFAVFRLRHPHWTWNSLPTSYLTSPRLSLDQQSIDNYFNTTSDPSLTPEVSTASGQNLHKEDEDRYSATLPKKQVWYGCRTSFYILMVSSVCMHGAPLKNLIFPCLCNTLHMYAHVQKH